MDPPWLSRGEARGLYLSVSLCHRVDMNAKCVAAANKMLNEVELTGTWLLVHHWNHGIQTQRLLSIPATQGQWRNGGELCCCLQSSKANWTNYQATCKTFGHQADITPPSTIDCHRHTATLTLCSLPCCGEGSGLPLIIYDHIVERDCLTLVFASIKTF